MTKKIKDSSGKEENSGSSIKKKCLKFYFKGSEQKLIIFEGTPPQDIIYALKTILGINEGHKLLFLEENGLPLVLSSFLPSNTKIFVSLGDQLINSLENTSGKAEENQEKKEWKWSRPNSKADFIDDLIFTTFDELRTEVYGEMVKTKGKHYWRIKISHLMCCHDFGICDGKLDADFDVSYQNSSEKVVGIPGALPGHKSGPASTGCSYLNIKDNIFGIFVDVDKKVCLIVNETEKILYTKETYKFNNVVPFYVARKHKVEVALIETGGKGPEWVNNLV